MNQRRTRIYEGKAKILYEGPEPGTVVVHFKDAAAVDAFSQLVGPGVAMGNDGISDKTRFIWYPEIEIEDAAAQSYRDDGDA